MDRKSGFTLIELLVVISIIGLLASVVLSSLNSARVGARDAKRLADMNTIRTALLGYEAKYGALPITSVYSENGTGGWDRSDQDSDGDGNYFLDFLVEEGTLPGDILDPLNGSTYQYRYYCYPSGASATYLRLGYVSEKAGNLIYYINEPGHNCSTSATLPHNQ